MLYALAQPAGLESLIVQSSPASVPLWLEELAKLRAALPPDVEATLRKHEDAGTTEDPEYEEATMVFYGRHVCRVPWPPYLARMFETLMANPEVYFTMNGPSEFHVIGPSRTSISSSGSARSARRRFSSRAATTRSHRPR